MQVASSGQATQVNVAVSQMRPPPQSLVCRQLPATQLPFTQR